MADKVKELEHVTDDEVIVLDNEFEQIRQCLGMYIGIGEKEGVMHLTNEVTTNCIDESVNPEVIKAGWGDTIEFYFEEGPCRFTIKDNGRGMPLDKMMELVGRKHAGTKFRSITSANRYSGGQNGVGVTVTAALADSFQVTCWRDGKQRSLHVDGNHLVDDGVKSQDGSKNKHGTMISFVPSRKWIGDFKIELADVEDYLRRLSYILPNRVKVKYMGTPKKGKPTVMIYKPQGIAANVEYLGEELIMSPIYIQIPEIVIPNDDPDREPDYFKMEFAFAFDKKMDAQPVAASFCNYIATKDGGYHETAVSKAIADFFTKQCSVLDPQHKYPVNQDDCRTGLVFAVNCDHSNPNFEGQHKSRVGQRDIPKYARKPIIDALTEYFQSNNGLLKKISGYLHQIAKARLEINKIKVNVVKKTGSFLDDAKMKNFSNISDRNYSGYKELILAEGDSAVAALGAARNVICQAIYAITGVVPNTYGLTTAQVLQSPTYAQLTKILGCGIGADFDITKLKWDAVIGASDADVDGGEIFSLVSVFFGTQMPEIITHGKFYRMVPPLYLIDTRPVKKFYTGRDYLFDKSEYYALLHRLIAENMKIAVIRPKNVNEAVKGKGEVRELSTKEKIAMFDANIGYLDELDNIKRRAACNETVLEYIIYFQLLAENMEQFLKMLKTKFPELSYDDATQTIHGSYNYQNVTLIMDNIFQRISARMSSAIERNHSFHVLCKAKKANQGDDPHGDDWELMSYGQLMRMCNDAFKIPILQRYKGLGEMETIMVFPSMMNPKTRKLIRVTSDDIKRTIARMEYLHGDSPKMREARRKMLEAADITAADIDN